MSHALNIPILSDIDLRIPMSIDNEISIFPYLRKTYLYQGRTIQGLIMSILHDKHEGSIGWANDELALR